MKQFLIESLDTISRWIPYGIYPLLIKRDVIGVFYHAVSDQVMPHVCYLYPVVPVSDFREAMVTLKNNYTFVSYDTLQACYDQGIPLPSNALHLSFDDGFSECFTVVRPILLEMEIPCTFFITIDWLDNQMLYFRHQISLCVHHAKRLPDHDQVSFFQAANRQFDVDLPDMAGFTRWITGFRAPQNPVIAEVCRLLDIDIPAYLRKHQPYLSTAQVEKLHADGFTIGAHGFTHRKLGFVSREDLEMEIAGSCQAIQKITRQAVVPFSFPQSAANVDRVLLADILERNHQVGLLFDTKDLRTDASFMVNRIWAERPLTPDRGLHTIATIFEHAYRDAWVEGVLKKLRRG
jgi:peptidoglycan/xylan/chitin deacetylase (PgdA/CDA1 family)